MPLGAMPGQPELVPVGRRGPVLRPSATAPGVFGVDLTAGCAHGCSYCPVRAGARGSADSVIRVPFDPYTTETLAAALDAVGSEARTIVLSPQSDPLPALGPVRHEALRVSDLVLGRGLNLVILTRGRFSRSLITLLSRFPSQARVGLGLFTLKKPLVRVLEPWAASPGGRVRDVRRLVQAGVPVEVRLEPLIPGLTDTRDNLAPLFHELAEAGATRVVAHYVFSHPNIQNSLGAALEALHMPMSLSEMFAEGPRTVVGTLGQVRNLPRDVRREGLARVMSWGAEFGLEVSTGAAQNPDLPQVQGGATIPALSPASAKRSMIVSASLHNPSPGPPIVVGI